MDPATSHFVQSVQVEGDLCGDDLKSYDIRRYSKCGVLELKTYYSPRAQELKRIVFTRGCSLFGDKCCVLIPSSMIPSSMKFHPRHFVLLPLRTRAVRFRLEDGNLHMATAHRHIGSDQIY